MKRMIFLMMVACASETRAQLFDTSAAQAELVATLMGTGRVFVANVTVKRERGGKQVRIAENVMYMRDGDLRLEHRPADEPALAKAVEKLKRENLAEVVTVLLPRANKAYLILPGRRACFEAAAERGVAPRRESKFLRTEQIGNHLCTVRTVTFVGEDDSRQQITVWEATDMDGFILKSQMDRGDDTHEVLYFSNIRTERPDDTKFSVPAGYRRLKGEAAGAIVEAMMQFDLERDAAVAELLR
ncbi:MAG: hypothetical protein N3B01_06275 [Verrucomicrobiae bacterium]|nr:hypothetical protein [Verrucomicrobiae bacterium]